MVVSEWCRRLLRSVAAARRAGVVNPGVAPVATLTREEAKDILRHLLKAAAEVSFVLTEDESHLIDALATRLEVPLVWRWYDLKNNEWHEGRRETMRG